MGEAPWLFSCEVAVGQFSKLVGQARKEEEELQEALDPQVVQVVLRRVARDHNEQDRVSFRMNDVRACPGGLEKGHTSQHQTLRLVGTWHAWKARHPTRCGAVRTGV